MSVRFLLDDINSFSVWNRKRMPRTARNRRVLIAHEGEAVGRSIALLLRLKGISSLYAGDIEAIEAAATCGFCMPLF